MTRLSAGANLNSLTVNVRYCCASGSDASSMSNLPSGFPNSAFVMDVIPIGLATGSNCAQVIYTRNNQVPMMFIRILSRDASLVGSWYKATLDAV